MDLRFIYFLAVLGFVRCKLVHLKCDTIKSFVDGHNSRRLQLAKGMVPNQPAASKMNSIIWDEELAKKASKWAANEKYSHNPDRTIPSKRFGTGENIYQYKTTNFSFKGFDPDWAIKAWFEEYKDYHYKKLEKSDFSGPQIGHYTQLVWSNSVYLGCAISQFQTKKWNIFLVVCNYGPSGNFLGQTPYKSGKGCGVLTCGASDCSRMYGESCHL